MKTINRLHRAVQLFMLTCLVSSCLKETAVPIESAFFKDLGQFKAYIRNIDSFDQLYIIQQGGRNVTKEDIIKQLEKAIAKDAENVYISNQRLWNELGVENANNLQKKCKTNELSKSEQFQEFRNMITITK